MLIISNRSMWSPADIDQQQLTIPHWDDHESFTKFQDTPFHVPV